VGGGSGGVAVGPLERGGRGGSNGGSWNLVVAVLAELWWFEIGVSIFFFFFFQNGGYGWMRHSSLITSGSGWVAVGSFKRGYQCGSNGTG
jgi:hypothetical protein